MRIIIAKNAGFCFGVKRALDIALATKRKYPKKKIYTLGPLIHNPQVVASLTSKGIKAVQKMNLLRDGVLVIRSHGIPPQILEKLKKIKGLIIIDATCPYVKKAQNLVTKLIQENYLIVIVGDKKHPEVKALQGFAQNKAIIANRPKDLEDISFDRKIGLISQTTQSWEKFSKIASALTKQAKEIKIYNTICEATKLRQQEALKIAQKVDSIIVVGGYNSANTKRLVKLCRKLHKKVMHIEEAQDLAVPWLKKAKSIGILAGASTPPWLIKEVTRKIENNFIV